jgi:hypothetical protein
VIEVNGRTEGRCFEEEVDVRRKSKLGVEGRGGCSRWELREQVETD